jgi:hypothetical protein
VKLWREHQLLVVLVVLTLIVGATTVWATWIEYDHNEGLGMENKAHFVSWNFFSYCYMQLGWNTVAEWVGFIFVLVFAAKLREKFEAEK